MEPLTKEDLSDVPEEEEITKEDLSDVSEEEETLSKPNVVTGKDFAKLVKKAGKLGAVSLDYSPRKNNKYVATLKDRKKVHFGTTKYPNFLIHYNEERKETYLARAKKITNKQKELTWKNPESANYWSTHLLWF